MFSYSCIFQRQSTVRKKKLLLKNFKCYSFPFITVVNVSSCRWIFFFYRSETTMEDKDSAILRRHLKCKKAQLSKLMSKPLFPKGFSGKYLDGSLELQLQQNNQTAVELMKKSIDENPKARKSRTSSIAPKSHAIKKGKRKWKRTKK